MLTFRNTNIFFAALLIVLIGIDIKYATVPFYIYLLLIFVYSLILFYGCTYIQSGFFIKTICSANTTKKQIAISFDDGPATAYTPEILQVLKDNSVEAAFFCIGNRIAGNETIFQQLHHEGHIIGNHSHTHHFWFDLFSSQKMSDDLTMMDEATKHAIGLKPTLFRPPYGVINPNLKKAILKGNYTTIGWNVRSLDTATTDESKLLNKVVAALKPGAVYLFHDTQKVTLNILPAFIKMARQNGYEIVRLDKMLNLIPYA